MRESDFEIVKEVLKSGWVVQGPKVKEFENLWSDFTGAKHSVAVSSCTTALHLALVASGADRSDEVILPAYTWIATANAVEYTGATPVFCDIDIRTFNIDTVSAEKKITKKTKVIIPVHLFGLNADMDRIMEIAGRHNLKVVEDAACGFGAYNNGKHSGTSGNFGCFSFHPRKAITTGEGGMITTGSEENAKLLRSLRDHGAEPISGSGNIPYLLPEFNKLGYNYRMTDIQAALGTAQLSRAGIILKERRETAAKYDALLQDLNWLRGPYVPEGFEHGYQSYVCLFKPEEAEKGDVDKITMRRNQFMQFLYDRGISTRPGTHALHIQGYYEKKYKYKPQDYPKSFAADKCSVALPMYAGMTDDEFNHVAECIYQFGRKAV
ncbi:MAG: DegT/DnrJ/EryC1/StrS family aminotransferase [Bacteroidetes bacterium]|nr:DegT/DnrJ/EryC1/StrS family aminotransferase [Bacteroidota bacterium]